MADCWRVEGAAVWSEASSVFHRLKALQCPPLEGLYLIEAETMQELLCTPSVHRLDILEWICTRICPSLQDQFSVLKESQADVKIKEMANLGFKLMMCRADDLDLLQGLASPRRQLSFMNELVDVLQSPDIVTKVAAGSAEESVRADDELLFKMIFSPHFQATLNPECNPWPSDFKSLLLGDDPLQKRHHLAAKTKDSHLEENLKELEETLARLEEQKEEVKKECSFLGDGDTADRTSSSSMVQALRLAVTDFLQLMDTFSEVYESEFRAHCSRSPPRISGCGSQFNKVHQSLDCAFKELQAIAQVAITSENIVSTVQQQQEKKQSWGSNRLMTLAEKLDELKRKYNELHKAVQSCAGPAGPDTVELSSQAGPGTSCDSTRLCQ